MQSKRADIRIINSETLSDNWYNLKKYTFDLQRSDGDWQRQEREVYDRGNGATILLYNRDSKTVILTRQFRFPVFINGHEEDLIELLEEQYPLQENGQILLAFPRLFMVAQRVP